MDNSLTVVKFLELIGWGEWFKHFYENTDTSVFTFSDLVFGTLPFMLQLFLVIFLLNWVMGIIGDTCKIIARGGRL